ncbi:hypothetical protein D9758_002129 [Tetrapyrgos nigripes]|uniref:F-box domain-containing protein n=1 Tax=Tetrapyrgos nigripes TaxID=182062 RepID=A0A8H5GTF6_9AGAR|nr:hypothetical protein D9758_002129 [Tetrapyrgos nigripes]
MQAYPRDPPHHPPKRVSELPDSLLSSIFLRCSPSDAVERTLSRVCQRWRNVALDLPALWTRIVLDCPAAHQEDVLQTYLQRAIGTTRNSPPLPLELYIEGRDSTPWTRLIRIIHAHKPLWRAISIRVLSGVLSFTDAAAQFTHLDLPLIEHLSIIFHIYPQDDEKEILMESPVIIFAGSTHVKTLRLQGTGAAYLQLAKQNVTTLHLKESAFRVRECPDLHILLQFFPSLVHLSLLGDFVRIGLPQPRRIIDTPNLRSLRVSDSTTLSTLLLSLSAPGLEFLTLRNFTCAQLQLFRERYEPWSDSPNADRFPKLRTLVLIRPEVSKDELRRLFSDFASITRLDLINCFSDDALEVLAEKNPDLGRVGLSTLLPLPYLEILSVHHLRNVEQALGQFVSPRAEAGGSIPKLRLHANIPRSEVFSLLHENIIWRWDKLDSWPLSDVSASEYRVFEDEHDLGMQMLTKPPNERNLMLNLRAPQREDESPNWWQKLGKWLKRFIGFS